MNKLLKILIIIAIIAALGVGGYVLFRSVFEQREFIDVATEVSGQAAGLGTQATNYVKGNIPTIVAAGTTVTAVSGVALSKINTAKQQASDIKTAANSQLDSLKSEKDKLSGIVSSQTTQLTELKEKVLNLETTNSAAELKAGTLQTQNEAFAIQINQFREDIRTLKIQTATLEVVK